MSGLAVFLVIAVAVIAGLRVFYLIDRAKWRARSDAMNEQIYQENEEWARNHPAPATEPRE